MSQNNNIQSQYVVVNRKDGDKTQAASGYDGRNSSSLMAKPQPLSGQTVREWEKRVLQDPKNRLALSALTVNSIPSVLSQRKARIADIQEFNIRIPFEGSPATNQQSSGRCWLFASTNIFRLTYMRTYDIPEFQLSQSYLFFWDKLEKANYFLEQIIDTEDQRLDSRLVQALLSNALGDGGQWDMVANLVQKYGLVPYSMYPDALSAVNSSPMNELLVARLREGALEIRDMCHASESESSVQKTKYSILTDIHRMLTLLLGPPPKPDEVFTWQYEDRQGRMHSRSQTPLEFAALLSSTAAIQVNSGTDVRKLMSLVHDPRHDYGDLLTVSRLGNIVEGRPVTYANVSMETMKSACIAMLKAGIPVFFGSHAGRYLDREAGIFDTALLDYELGFGIQLGMDKVKRMITGESHMTHAMMLTGVHLVDDKSIRWRVENSWGPNVGDKGYFVMTDDWMTEFVFQAVIDPKFVSNDVKNILKKEPIVLPRWDPMGALAKS